MNDVYYENDSVHIQSIIYSVYTRGILYFIISNVIFWLCNIMTMYQQQLFFFVGL